jgi:hypothetical protein
MEVKDMDAMAATGTMSAWGISISTEVYDVEGEHIGKVSSADTVSLVVSSGWMFGTDYEISMSEVGQYDDGKLFLKRTKAEVLGE